MPFSTSYFKQQTKEFIIKNFPVDTKILDIGAGAGAYFDMLSSEGYMNIDCVEAFEDYIKNYNLESKYSKVFHGDVTKLNINFDDYDLVILGDVLEHIELENAKTLLSKMNKSAVIVGVPFNSSQDISFNNTFEIHLQDDLTFINFFKRFKGFKPFCLRWDYGLFLKGIDNDTIFLETQEFPIPTEYTTYLQSAFNSLKTIDIEDTSSSSDIPILDIKNKNLTVVTGLWDLDRPGRDFKQYIEQFEKILETPVYMFIYIPKQYEYLVWRKRSRESTYVKIYELEDIKNDIYKPHWEKTQQIRTNPEWFNSTGEKGWLSSSPQAVSEYYNPVVQSKMFFLHSATIWNPFTTDYFIWLDAGITFTVYEKYFTENRILDNINQFLESFLFLSYPYKASSEIHGFDFNSLNKLAGKEVKFVCRGGLFGGHRELIDEANTTYYSLLSQTLDQGLMGTEESIFSIMATKEPYLYRTYMLDENGLIVKFAEALHKNLVKLETVEKVPTSVKLKIFNSTLKNLKTNLYILTFNFPEQLIHTINSMKRVPEWLEKPNLILLDNSTNDLAKEENLNIANEYNFEYISLEGNRGICGGRQAAAEHFHNSDSDYYFFFEDDMTINSSELEGEFCRNGFRKYIPNLYSSLHKIMLKEEFDFLKLSFTEVYWDNDIQTSWYNVPQDIRTKYWPEYDRLPVTGRDPNAPRTVFSKIGNVDRLAYIDGEVTYTNWPMIMSKKGNKKVFIDTKWEFPYEQTWMSYVFQEQKKGNIKAAVLLASPIWHERIKYYEPEERREN